jgi:AbrB family looped-hinge helix DNA binding protein
MRITSKGQVTIPQAVREKAGFLPNTEVDFVFKRGEVVLVKGGDKGAPTRGDLLIATMRRAKTLGMSADELLAMTRGE